MLTHALMQLEQTKQHLASWLMDLIVGYATASLRPRLLFAAAALVPCPHALQKVTARQPLLLCLHDFDHSMYHYWYFDRHQ